MLVLSVPSSFVPNSSSKEPAQKLFPIVTSKEVLGKGSFGIVFGPFSATRMRDIFYQLYETQDVEAMTGMSRASFSKMLPESDRYILKVTLGNIYSSLQEIQWLDKKLQCLPAPMKRLFLTPLIVGKFYFGQYEIQRYGGEEFYKVLKNKTPWNTMDRLHKAISCFHRLAESCFMLIEDAHVMITDIKPQNMVYNETSGEVSLIDLEYIHLDLLKKKAMIYTPSVYFVPIQFFNSNFFPNMSQRNDVIKKYLKTSQYGDLHKKHSVQKKVGLDSLKKIAQFSILWVMVYMVYFVVAYKYSTHTLLVEKTKALIEKMQSGPRWRGDFMAFLKEMKKLGNS